MSAQPADAGWRLQGVLSAGAGEADHHVAGATFTLSLGGELRAWRGPFLLGLLGELHRPVLNDREGALVLLTRNDSLFQDLDDMEWGSPRVGLRAGGRLPLESVRLLLLGGGGWVRNSDFWGHGDDRMEPWVGAGMELRSGRVGVQVEHGRDRPREVLRYGGPPSGPAVDGPILEEPRWRPFTRVAILLLL